MNDCRPIWRRRSIPPRERRGVVLVVLIVLLTLMLVYFGVWAKRTLSDRLRLETQQRRLQAIALAEAGVERAIAQHAADAKFETETWTVPADELDQKHSGEVRLKIVPGDRQGKLRYEATAQYPAGELRCVQITKAIEIPD